MNRYLLIGLGAAGLGALALLGSQRQDMQGAAGLVGRRAWLRVQGPPSGNGVSWQIHPTGLQLEPYLNGIPLRLLPDGKGGSRAANIGVATTGAPQTSDGAEYLARHVRFAQVLSAEYQARKRTLPADALKVTDGYSKELYPIPSWVHSPESLSLYQIQAYGPVPTDEYGRLKPGEYGSGGSFLSMFGALAANPLFQVALQAALIYFTGGASLYVMGAYSMWQARGQELSVQNVAIAAGRAYVVSQCGEGCGMAFDFGVGMASGKSYDEAAEDALLKQLTPEQRGYYEQGKQAYNDAAGSLT